MLIAMGTEAIYPAVHYQLTARPASDRRTMRIGLQRSETPGAAETTFAALCGVEFLTRDLDESDVGHALD